MTVDDAKEDLYLEGPNPSDVQKVLDTQKKIMNIRRRTTTAFLQLMICYMVDLHVEGIKQSTFLDVIQVSDFFGSFPGTCGCNFQTSICCPAAWHLCLVKKAWLLFKGRTY